MKNKLVALFCIALIISSSLSVNVYSEDQENDRGTRFLKNLFSFEEETGESIVINVDSIEPFPGVPTNLIENQNVPVYVYLKGTTGAKIFKPGEETVEHQAGATLDFLL